MSFLNILALAISETSRKTGCKLEGMQQDREPLLEYSGCKTPGYSKKLSFKGSSLSFSKDGFLPEGTMSSVLNFGIVTMGEVLFS